MNPQLEEAFVLIENFGRFLGLHLSPATCQSKVNILKRFFRHFVLAGKDYKQITKEDIELYLSVQEWKQDFKAQSIVALTMFYDHLKDKHILADNPAKKIPLPLRNRRSLFMVPRRRKIRSILRKLTRDKTPQGITTRLLVELAYGSGLRRAELATLNVEDINVMEQTAHVLGKGNKERIVPLSKRFMNVFNVYLQKVPPGQKPLFVQDNGRRITVWQVGKMIKTSTGLNPHYFRHACATHMLLNGCNIVYIQQLLGHSEITTTQIYTQLYKEDLRKEINAKHPGRRRSDDPNTEKDI
jgi:site-specific recombinase XerD